MKKLLIFYLFFGLGLSCKEKIDLKDVINKDKLDLQDITLLKEEQFKLANRGMVIFEKNSYNSDSLRTLTIFLDSINLIQGYIKSRSTLPETSIPKYLPMQEAISKFNLITINELQKILKDTLDK